MSTFQDGKDSFFLALRDRLAALNPDRTVMVRGAMRPAVLVAENEMEPGSGADVRDAFVLRWGATTADGTEAMVLEQARCEIRFSTAGSPELMGMDRGRVLAAMRAELDRMLQPAIAAKTSIAGPTPVAAITPVFWSEVVEERTTETAGEVTSTCVVAVFAWKEMP